MKTFTIHDIPGLTGHISDGIQKAAKRAALATANRMVSIIQTELIPGESLPPIFDGHYSSGWHAEPTEEGADVYNDMPYAPVIEWGARAQNIKIGRAMIAALTEWVMRKGLVGKLSRSADARAEQEVEARQIAWAIAVSMKTKGIFNRDGRQGLRIGERAAARAQEFLGEEFQRELRRAMGG